jgi:outer membrane protein TolC
MKRYLAIFCALGLTALANAQEEVPQPLTLTWMDCVGLAARNNPDLLASLSLMAASQAGYKGSYNGILPQLSLSNSYAKGRNTSHLWTLAGNASLNLIDFSEWATIESSLAAYKESKANVRSTA